MSTLTKKRKQRGRKRLVRTVLGAVALTAALGLGAMLFVLWGAYNVSALQQHTEPVYRIVGMAMERSVALRADSIPPPSLDEPAMIARGFRYFRDDCVQCHGAPGVARDDVGKGMTPLPSSLVQTARNLTPSEIFWTIKNGVKMSGMPAWEFVYTDEDIWSIVAFVMQLPRLSPVDYQVLAADASPVPEEDPDAASAEPAALLAPDPERGRKALMGYACTACHTIPGVIGAEVDVGPPLQGMAARRYIAGVLPNTFDNMVLWILAPQEVDPLSAMPDMGVEKQDALDMAAYIETLE